MHTQSLEQQLNPLQQPAKELLNLNLKTLQQFKYLNPVELMGIKKPEEILEKNMELLIENGHHALDYMHSVFHIMEKNWFLASNNLIEDTKIHMNNTQRSIRSNVNEIVNSTTQTVKKAAATPKRSEVSSKRPARSASAKVAKNTSVRTHLAKKSGSAAVNRKQELRRETKGV